MLATRDGYLDIVRQLLERGADPDLNEGSYGFTPLRIASANGDTKIIKLLLKYGANPNIQIDGGSTALHGAIINNQVKAVKILLQHGANPNAHFGSGITNLEQASKQSPEMVDLLLEYGAKINPLILEAYTKLYHMPYYPIPRYPLTGRPITPMPFLSTDFCSGSHYLPVLRYTKLYQSKREGENIYCGTFYFFDPDSNRYLSLGKILIANNKVDAYWKLFPYLTEDAKETVEKIEKSRNKFRFSLPSVFLQDQGDADKDYQIADQLQTPLYLNQNGVYIGRKFMGNFDYLDQIICRAGIRAGFDTILLQREPGESRAVSEILDLRPREESYRDTCEIDTPDFHLLAENSKYPTIWFGSYGFYSL